MKITLVKQLNGHFKVAYDSDYEKVKKIKVNEFYEFDYKQPRNVKFHKKFFALMNLVYQNQEQYNNIEHLRKKLTIASGFYEMVYDLETGKDTKEALSISFAQMDEIAFSEFYNRIIDVIVKWLQIDKQDLIDNIQEYF